MNKFEQLIEFVINDDEAKARELFHDIVVEKSREIYENLMNEEAEEELDEGAEEDSEEDEGEEELDEGLSAPDADSADNLIDDVEAEEEGMYEEEAEEEGEEVEFGAEEGEEESGEGLEDRVVDLEDKLDELMAEFESLMGQEEAEHDDFGDEEELEIDAGGDALEMDDTDTAEFGDMDETMGMMENVTLDKVPAPKHGDDGANNKSVVAFNSGAKGMQGAPVKMTGDTAQGRSAPKTGDLPQAGQFKNVPGKGGANSKLAAAPKPVTAQASGVNTKSPVGKA